MIRKHNPQDEIDVEQLAMGELSRLQRQYRIMEGERESSSQEVAFLLQKQRITIEALEKDKENLITNLRVAKSKTNERKTSDLEKKIAKMLEEWNKLDSQIKLERSQSIELDVQVRKVEKGVNKLRLIHVVTDARHLETVREGERNISILENRLHVVTLRFNEMLTENGKQRQEIGHLLKERTHFNLLYQKLILRLNCGKKVMLDLIEQATLAYDQREEAQSKLQVLRERGRQDLHIHSQEMRELQRKLDHDTKLQDFLGVKGQKRILTDLEAREALKRQQQRDNTERLIFKYQNILDQIKEFSGEDDVDRLAARFVKQEEENFALFNYVNELNNELETLQDQVEDLHHKIDDQHMLNKQRAQQQQDKLGVLNGKLGGIRKEAEVARKQLNSSSKLLEAVLKGIEKVFYLIRCDRSPLLDLLGNNAHVTTYNVLLYLGIIERRTNTLLNTVFYLEMEDDDRIVESILKDATPTRLRPVPVNISIPSHPCILCVEQIEIEQCVGMKDIKIKPLTQKKTLEKLKKQEKEQPGFAELVHNVSACKLPRSRRIMQRRYE